MLTASEPSSNAARLYATKRVAISGASGYLGSALTERLREIGSSLRLIVHRESSKTMFDGVEIVRAGDISDRKLWIDVLEGADYVFHLAAYEHRHGAAYEPLIDLQTNVVSLLTLLETCRNLRTSPVIVFASSNNIVGRPDRVLASDETDDDPLTLWSLHKLMAERYLSHYSREHSIRSVALRLPNIFGPTPNRRHATRVALNAMIHSALREGKIRLFANHKCVRDYLVIDDAIDAFLLAGTAACSGERFMIGTGAELTIAQVAESIASRVESRIGRRPAIEIDESVSLEPVEWRSFTVDWSRFSKLTGWKPRVPLSTGIDRTIDFLITSEPDA